MKEYLECFKREKIIYKLITFGIIAITIYFIYLICGNVIQGMTYLRERYELVNARFTQAIIDGNNPFVRRDMLPYGVEPPVVYEYAFVSSYVCALVSMIVGIINMGISGIGAINIGAFNVEGNVLLAHYIVSALSVICSGMLLAAIVRRYSKTTVGPTLTFLLVIFCHWRYGYISSAPDSFCLFLTVLVLYMAVCPGLKHKELLCTIGLILIFYTKQYMVGVCISLFVYFFIQSHKSAIKLLLYCLVLTPLSMVVVSWLLPYYWDYSVLFLLLGSKNGSVKDGILYALEQFGYLSFIFCGLYFAIIAWLIKQLCSKKKINTHSPIMLFAINTAVQFVVMMYFARNDGTYLTYFLQAVYPSLIVVATVCLEKMKWHKYELINVGMYAAIALFTIYFGWHKLPMHTLTSEEIGVWEEAYSLMDDYRQDGEVYHTCATSLEGARKGDSLFHTGHDTCLNDTRYNLWKESTLYKKIFPDAGQIFEEENSYREYVCSKIKDHKVSMVSIPDKDDWYLTRDFLTQSGYHPVEKLDLRVGTMTYPTEFWAYR